ncbi:MAG: pilus assembly protein CpaE [Actinomycetota bacterium]|nr:pilus assembly protein CpaE [Actinomycetota bacterium]
MAARVVLVSESPVLKDRFATVLLEAPDIDLVDVVTDPHLAAQAADRDDVDVLILDESMTAIAADALTRDLVGIRPFLAVVWIALPGRPEVLAQAMISGARSVIAQPLSVEGVKASVISAAEWSASLREHIRGTGLSSGTRGRVVAVAGAKGGVGTTVLATLLASHCVRPTRSVVLVDLDLRNGSVAAYTNVVARRSVADLAEVSRELTNRSVREVVADHPSGLSLVLAPDDVEQADEVTAPAVRQILAQLRMQFDLIVVDCGSRLDDTTAMALEVADDVLLVATTDVVSLRAARRSVESWRRLSIRASEHVHLVLNRTSRRAEVQADLAEQIVPLHIVGQIPASFFKLESQLNTGLLEGRPGPVHAALDAVARTLRLIGEPTRGQPGQPGAKSVTGAGGRGRRSRTRTDSGQVTIELPFLVAVMCLLGVVAAQMLLWGTTHLIARHAADEAARTAAVSAYSSGAARTSLDDIVRQALPAGWDDDFTVSRPDAATVRVRVGTPALAPGLADALEVVAEAAVVEEGP